MLCLRSTGNGDSVILSDSNSHIPFLGNSDTVFYSKWMVTTDILKIIFQPRPVTVTSERTQLPATTSPSPSPPLPVTATTTQPPSRPRNAASHPHRHNCHLSSPATTFTLPAPSQPGLTPVTTALDTQPCPPNCTHGRAPASSSGVTANGCHLAEKSKIRPPPAGPVSFARDAASCCSSPNPASAAPAC